MKNFIVFIMLLITSITTYGQTRFDDPTYNGRIQIQDETFNFTKENLVEITEFLDNETVDTIRFTKKFIDNHYVATLNIDLTNPTRGCYLNIYDMAKYEQLNNYQFTEITQQNIVYMANTMFYSGYSLLGSADYYSVKSEQIRKYIVNIHVLYFVDESNNNKQLVVVDLMSSSISESIRFKFVK